MLKIYYINSQIKRNWKGWIPNYFKFIISRLSKIYFNLYAPKGITGKKEIIILYMKIYACCMEYFS